MANEIRCKACGEKCLDTDSFCHNCHASLTTQGKTLEEPVENIEIELWRQFIGKKSESFLKVFRKNEGKNFFLSFNGWAFLFNSTWFFWRKMYLYGMIYEVIRWLWTSFVMSLAVVGDAGLLPDMLAFAIIPLTLLLPLASGFTGMYLYREHAKKQIVKTGDMQKGGTSLGAALGLTFAGSIIYSIIEDALIIVFSTVLAVIL